MIATTYNQRLFSKNIRGYVHTKRFVWLNDILTKMRCKDESVFELGCFDAKTLNYLPNIPKRYVGVDSNWENGLTTARQTWDKYTFIESNSPEEIDIEGNFDIGICQETLEHIDPKQVPDYLKKMADLVNGYVFITIPNEIGTIFFFKQLYKILSGNRGTYYPPIEFLYQTLGKTNKVEREIGGHKGFNYKHMIDEISKHFYIISIENIQTKFLPPHLACNVGIIGKPKRNNK